MSDKQPEPIKVSQGCISSSDQMTEFWNQSAICGFEALHRIKRFRAILSNVHYRERGTKLLCDCGEPAVVRIEFTLLCSNCEALL